MAYQKQKVDNKKKYIWKYILKNVEIKRDTWNIDQYCFKLFLNLIPQLDFLVI